MSYNFYFLSRTQEILTKISRIIQENCDIEQKANKLDKLSMVQVGNRTPEQRYINASHDQHDDDSVYKISNPQNHPDDNTNNSHDHEARHNHALPLLMPPQPGLSHVLPLPSEAELSDSSESVGSSSGGGKSEGPTSSSSPSSQVSYASTIETILESEGSAKGEESLELRVKSW